MKKCLKSKYFTIDPSDFFDYLFKSDDEAGRRFKEMLGRLFRCEAPEGSVEEKMIQLAEANQQRHREIANKRWHPEINEETRTMENRPKIPPIPPIRSKPPLLEDVYDFCDSCGFPPPFGREWYEFQEGKGWNTIRTHWKVALKAFCQKKMNNQK